jgi:hypothetical protein
LRSFNAALSQIRLRKVIAFVEQWQPMGLRASVGEAIAEIEVSFVPNSLAIVHAGVDRAIADVNGYNDVLGHDLGHKIVDQSAGARDHVRCGFGILIGVFGGRPRKTLDRFEPVEGRDMGRLGRR